MITTRGEQLTALRAEWDSYDESQKQEAVFITALLILMNEVDRDVALSVFSWARQEGLEAPELPEPEDIDLDAVVG
jgi:hypothetical protein